MSTKSKPVFPFNFEIKIKVPGECWEGIEPLQCKLLATDEDAAVEQVATFAGALAVGHQQEVRWNHKGSPMGHYTKG